MSAKEKLLVLNERIKEPTNGVRDIKDGDKKEGQLQWPVVISGSIGALGLVAATVFVRYSKRICFSNIEELTFCSSAVI